MRTNWRIARAVIPWIICSNSWDRIASETLAVYKALIDDGYRLSFADGIALEAERGPAHNAAVTPEMIEARRAAVQARGRSQ